MFGLWPLAVVAIVLGGCNQTAESMDEDYPRFTGTVHNYEAKSLLELESITIADRSGERREFFADGLRLEEFTPAHVREHMVLGDPVEVTYRESGDRLLIVSLRDAFDETPGPSGSP